MTWDLIGEIGGWLGTIIGIYTTSLYARRARRAEVKSKEIATADQMVDLVKKASADALAIYTNENEKLRETINRFIKVIELVTTCRHRTTCPVARGMQDISHLNVNTAPRPPRQHRYPRDNTRHDRGGEGGLGDDAGSH